MKSTHKVLKVSLASLTAVTGISAMTIPQTLKPIYAQVSHLKDMQTKNLVNKDTKWKYLDNNVDAGTENDRLAWTKGEYDDSTWKNAAGTFGAKNGAIVDLGSGYIPTVLLNQYINGSKGDVIPTYFFRTNVNIESVEDLSSLSGKLVYDDAAIVYINGKKVISFDEPEGGFETNMSYGGSNASTPKVGEINLSSKQLKDVFVEGKNTIAIELHNGRASSSDIYLEVQDLTLTYGEARNNIEQKGLNLTVGSDETQMNMTWYADTPNIGEVQYVEVSQLVNGEFPAKYQIEKASNNFSNDVGFSYNQVTLKGLKENTKYAYRVVNEDTYSEIHTFTTQNYNGSFNFILAGDPQIGASGNVTNDTNGWDKTLKSTTKKFNPSFILSAGDQVNTASDETQYAGYLNHDELTSIPQATTVGNHDSGSNSYAQHFNLPNISDKGKTNASSDYWYVYNNTLIMDINSNNTSTAEHEAFLKEAIEKNPDVRWKVVTFHHSVYSVASHAVDKDILQRREQLTPVFDKLGIDVVLMGHDHVYVRSHIMKDQKISQNTDGLKSVTDPDGILYVTANSASGSKFYNIKSGIDTSYAAMQDQSKQRSISNIEVSENEFKVTTYNYDANSDEWKQIDEFAIKKTEQRKEIEQKGLNLTVGSDETQMNMTWYANNTSSQGTVQFVEANQLVNGEFPTKYQTVNAVNKLSNDDGFYYYQATLKGLKENTKYAYRVVNEDKVSEIHYLTTKDFDGTFNFILAGDPQIGASGNVINDTNGWDKTLKSTTKKFNPSFILSAGDQVNTANDENQYAGYLNHDELMSIPQATTVGNHDSGSNSYAQHFNLPNISDKGKTNASSDYWYVYNNTLIMDINSNNMSTAEHEAFLKDAIEKNPDVRWKVVTFHHSVYSVASHAVDKDILQRREQLTPVFDQLGIDVVLMGHDHVYVRSHIMKEQKISQNTDGLKSVTDPDGILYVTANSASGSKFYNIKSGIDTSYAAMQDQSKQRSISNIEVSENEFKVTTYNYDANSDEWKQIDEFAIKKTSENVDSGDTDKPTDTEKPSTPGDTDKPTDTEKPSTPEDTDKPTDTEKPSTPGDTDKPADTEKPSTPEDTDKPTDIVKPSTPSDTTQPSDVVNTGDNTHLFGLSMTFILSALGLGFILNKRKKESE